MLKKLLCKIGLHHWVKHYTEIFFLPSVTKRYCECKYCGKKKIEKIVGSSATLL